MAAPSWVHIYPPSLYVVSWARNTLSTRMSLYICLSKLPLIQIGGRAFNSEQMMPSIIAFAGNFERPSHLSSNGAVLAEAVMCILLRLSTYLPTTKPFSSLNTKTLPCFLDLSQLVIFLPLPVLLFLCCGVSICIFLLTNNDFWFKSSFMSSLMVISSMLWPPASCLIEVSQLVLMATCTSVILASGRLVFGLPNLGHSALLPVFSWRLLM